MSIETNTKSLITSIKWKTYNSGDVDGCRVKISGDAVVTINPASPFGEAYKITRPAANSFMIYEDRGDWGTCLLDNWKNGHSHYLIKGKDDGTLEHLGCFNTWKAAQFAAAAVAAGYDLNNSEDLYDVRKQYLNLENERRGAALKKKWGLK